jgi:hypothetical protein
MEISLHLGYIYTMMEWNYVDVGRWECLIVDLGGDRVRARHERPKMPCVSMYVRAIIGSAPSLPF